MLGDQFIVVDEVMFIKEYRKEEEEASRYRLSSLQPYNSAERLAYLKGYVSPVIDAVETNANEIVMLMPQISK